MDALSDVLSTLRVRSMISGRCDGHGAWAFRFDAHPGHIKFGHVTRGRFQMRLDGSDQAVVFETGDFYMLVHGQPFVSASIPAAEHVQSLEDWRAARGADGVVRLGRDTLDESTAVELVHGRFEFEGEAGHLLLRHLPPIVRLRADNPAAAQLGGLLALLRSEDDATRPGSAIAQSSLASLVLVQALRVQLACSRQPPGWLGALADRRVGAALAAMHADLRQPWTVERLAQEAGMSRTAFALRFRELVGTTPVDYLTGWRMTVARNLLRTGEEAVARVAERVGYLSDTAFSAAFKRSTGQSPAAFRHQAPG